MKGQYGLRGLEGRRALISGGLGALGTAIVAELAASGARVVVNDIVDEAEARVPDGAAGYLAGNAAEDGVAAHLVEQAATLLDGLPEVVCCHAGIVVSKPILDYTLAEMEDVWRVNALGQFALAQAASRVWVAAGQPGHLIFTGSWVQNVPWPGITAYSASKAALKSIARSFARELAPHGIRANVIAPGIVGAGMAQKQWDTEPDYRQRAGKAIPLGHLQTPQSVADAVAYLASDLATYMTGATLLADGGASLYPMDDDEIAVPQIPASGEDSK